jgi:Ca2+-binding RTX toxin-like protein
LKRNKIIGSHLANTLTGTTNNDLIKGKKGDDIIDAGHGDDDIKGGKGKDRFRLSQGNDRILDYQIGESILVNSKIFGRDLEITQQGADLRISSTTGLNTELLNTDLTAFQETSALEFTNGS